MNNNVVVGFLRPGGGGSFVGPFLSPLSMEEE
jgi:hypothetical protein